MTMRPEPLPTPFDRGAFTLAEGAANGLSASRMRAKDLEAPYAGVRALRQDTPLTTEGRARRYVPKMPPGGFFSHATAAVLHGMWLPLERETSAVLDVSVVRPTRAPRDEGVRGHHLVLRPGLVRTVRGLPVADPVNTWCQLGTQLGLDDLIAAGDSLLTPDHRNAPITLERLWEAAGDTARPRHRMLARAVQAIRIGSRSRRESLLRLMIVAAGLPEPEVNGVILDANGRRVAESDLVFREHRTLVEYEGDYHRTDKERFRRDIAKYELLTDLAWRVVRVTEDDMRRPAILLARITRLLGG